MKIRLSQTDSINSINKNNNIQVGLNITSKMLPFSNVVGDVDSYQVFENERNNCSNYRLIITINPYCTNILFNPLTEIVKDEGSPDVKTVRDNAVADNIDNAYGLSRPSRIHMIMNTEYSRSDVGYVYLPGYDIFNNHIIRNKTFKIVNKYSEDEDNDENRNAFNTINDFLRNMTDGSRVQMGKRISIGKEPSLIDKHLYLYDDIMSFEESINTNLAEENGWIGFSNKNNIPSKQERGNNKVVDANGYTIYDELGISRVLSNYENCEFIDMYPDRSLFSFNPKVNSFRKRVEYNWDIVLTYPYRNEYCYDLITDMSRNINALKIMSITYTISANGSAVLLFRSYIKHGLERGSFFSLYINGEKYSRNIRVTNIGNLSANNDSNKLYYFYTTDLSLLEEIGFVYDTNNGKWEKEIIENGEAHITNDVNSELDKNTFRIRHIVNNIESDYYIRVFRKIPNLKNKKEELTDEIVKKKSLFENYLYGDKMNASFVDNDGEKKMINFNNEKYKLAFSRTIYNDASTQLTFTDTINIEHLIDNIGRPLHEFYITFIKANKGYKEWYGINHVFDNVSKSYKYEFNTENININSDNIEYSHCFGNISSGVDFYHEENDDSRIMEKSAQMGDIHLLNELSIYRPMPLETEINEHGCTIPSSQITDYDEFYGDIVEYVPSECREYILQPICHRFNTAQRELPENDIFKYFRYDEIEVDDLDAGSFTVQTTNEEEVKYYYDNTANTYTTIQRPEGYYYQAHYPVTLKEFGSLNQNAHNELKVREAKPSQKNGIYIEVTTTLNYGVVAGDIIYVCVDDENNYRNDKWFEFTVVYIEGKNKFYMQPYNMSWKDMKNKIKSSVGLDYNWITLSKVLVAPSANEDYTQLKLRRKNNNIPDYAARIDHNKFLWRDLYRPGELLDSDLTQYPFANNAFYINKEINFFLKRQDPYGYSGLYCSQAFPNDVEGNHRQEDNYVYKTEEDIVC